MNIYTVILFTICILKIGFSLGKHGESKVTEYDFRYALVGQSIVIFLLLKSANIL